jgi:transposase-like protein
MFKYLFRYLKYMANDNKIRCVHCKKSNYVKKGFRQTENRGKIQRYRCLDCGKLFTNDEGFYRMRNSESKITAAIDLYFSNLSSRKVRNHFRRHLEHNASHMSVLDWARRYTLKVQKYIAAQQPMLSGEFYADETLIDRDGNKDVYWCSVDWQTRYINATLYSPYSQNLEDAITFMRKIKTSHSVPKYIQTDGLPFYPGAFRKAFAWHKTKNWKIQHKINNVSSTGKHNVRIETVFSKIKDRTDDFRGLKALWSAPILMNGIIIQHNYIEQHTTTGQLPCELAGIKPVTGNNRWLGLIKISASSN